MSTAKFNTWLNTDNTENYKCRAWVNFNGTGTVAIRAQGNVSSITDNGAGDYTVNFTTALSDANYCATGIAAKGSVSEAYIISDAPSNTYIPNTNSIRFGVRNSTATSSDAEFVNVAIFR